MKRILVFVLVMMLSISMFMGVASAESASGTVNVSSGSLNVRSQASTTSSIIGSLYKGQKVNIISSSNGFYKIDYNNTVGYVSEKYITKNQTSTTDAVITTGTVRLSSGSLNVRSQANATSLIVGSLYNGAKVNITGVVNGFYKINYNGKAAYVSKAYVTNDQADIIVNAAKSTLGVKYVFGGATMNGFDCSGLTLYSYAKAGIKLPHQSVQQSYLGSYVSRANLQKGDLVFFDTNGGNDGINHVGIYVGDGNVIQAQSGLGRVAQINLSNSYWSKAYMTARRIII